MYENMHNFELLLENSSNLSITNTLQVYLNLDLTKNSQTSNERMNIKVNVINKMMKIIEESVESKAGDNKMPNDPIGDNRLSN